MILYHSISDGGGEKYLLKCLESQPYNTTLRDYIVAEYNGKIADKAETIVNDAADKTSFLGKILYKLKGENQ